MMIQLGKAEILKRHVPHAFERRIHTYGAFPHLLQKSAKLLGIHEVSAYQTGVR